MINNSNVAMLGNQAAAPTVDWTTNKDEVAGDKDGSKPEEKSSSFLPNI